MVAAFALTLLALTASPAVAVSDTDPDDAQGPLDLRGIDARFTQHDLRLTVSFHHDFRRSALRGAGGKGVRLKLGKTQSGRLKGYFAHPRHGRLIFRYGDGALGGSLGCIDKKARVRRPSTNVLRVTFPIIRGTYRVRALSRWVNGAGDAVKDGTGWLNLGRHVGIVPHCG